MINIPSVFASDLLGLLMMIILLLSRGWKIQTRLSESRIVFIMAISVIFGCVANTIAAFIDGKPGIMLNILNYFCNFILFSLNIIISHCYIVIVLVHINDRLSRFQLGLLFVSCFTEAFLLLANFFKPLVFMIDEKNVYQRGPLFWIYVVTEFLLLMYGLYVYIKGKMSGLLLTSIKSS